MKEAPQNDELPEARVSGGQRSHEATEVLQKQRDAAEQRGRHRLPRGRVPTPCSPEATSDELDILTLVCRQVFLKSFHRVWRTGSIRLVAGVEPLPPLCFACCRLS